MEMKGILVYIYLWKIVEKYGIPGKHEWSNPSMKNKNAQK
jgi:hypothetical protein